MAKRADKRTRGDIEDPERLGFILRDVLKQPELRALWESNIDEIEEDVCHEFSPIEKDQYLCAKSTRDDILAMISNLDREERAEEARKPKSLYDRLKHFIKIVAELEEKAKLRAESNSGGQWQNPYNKMNKIHAENDEEEINFERKKKITIDIDEDDE